jgi:TPR repeat protein/uncharacterized caspase-like protein
MATRAWICFTVAFAVLSTCYEVETSAQTTVKEVFDRQRPIAEGRRIALIIGNTEYQAGTLWGRLPNAQNDAAHIGALLSDKIRGDSRFEVELVLNGTRKQIVEAVEAFATRAKNADIALLYYTGHGFEYAKTNFIVPSDAPGEVKAVELGNFYIDMERIAREAHARSFNMIFVDACRQRVPIVLGEDGLSKAGDATEFASIQAPESIVFYASSPGGVAYDAAPPEWKLSPFALALAEGMKRPGMDAESILPRVADYVGKATADRARPQHPQVQGSWTKLFYFLPESSAALPVAVAMPPLTIDMAALSTMDEPVLIRQVLEKHPPAELRALADKGDPLALYILGYMYAYGKFLPVDLKQAEFLLKRAAETGNPAGQLEYGHFLLNRSKLPGKQQTAYALYEKAVAQDFAKAKTHLATALLEGQFGPSGVVKGYREKARRLLEEAAAQGHVAALAALLYHGDTVARVKALTMLQAVSAQGELAADDQLCSYNVSLGNWVAAKSFCTKAAEGLFVESQARLAWLYSEGKGVPASPTLARQWARIALSQEDLGQSWRYWIAPLGE